jgi:protein-tyrosine phosphatase
VIDLHCHLLHALDDGPETAAESMQMVHAFEQSGYHTVCATPHMVPGTPWMPAAAEIRNRVAALNQTIRDEGLKLEVVGGMEIALDPQIPALFDAGRLMPLGNAACLLIEPSYQQLPPGWLQVMFSIQARGCSILLAHPERCIQLAAQPDTVGRLVDAGVYMQVNWGSFFGQYGREANRTARLLAAEGWIHCLAGDSHHHTAHAPSRVWAAAAALGKMIGEENFRLLTTDNPRCLLAGNPPQRMNGSAGMPKRAKRRWWRFRMGTN